MLCCDKLMVKPLIPTAVLWGTCLLPRCSIDWHSRHVKRRISFSPDRVRRWEQIAGSDCQRPATTSPQNDSMSFMWKVILLDLLLLFSPFSTGYFVTKYSKAPPHGDLGLMAPCQGQRRSSFCISLKFSSYFSSCLTFSYTYFQLLIIQLPHVQGCNWLKMHSNCVLDTFLIAWLSLQFRKEEEEVVCLSCEEPLL